MKLAFLLLLSFSVMMAQQDRRTNVVYDRSRCFYCRMLIQEKTYGAEIETDKDSVLVFDATECVAAFLIDNKISTQHVKHIWSVNYLKPTALVEARSAAYIHSDKLLSPMSMNIAAFSSRAEADSVFKTVGGEFLSWQGVIELVRGKWFPTKKE